MAPSLSIFGDFTKDASAMYNNFRVYGTGLLMVMGTIVFIGVKFVNKFATVALACVLLSILAVYVGIFVNFNGNDNLQLVLRLLHVYVGSNSNDKLRNNIRYFILFLLFKQQGTKCHKFICSLELSNTIVPELL